MPLKETLLNSYIDVKGWPEEDVRKAARWLATETGTVMSEEDLQVWPDLGYHFLIADRRDKTVWVADKVDVQFKEPLTDLFFMPSREEPMTNTLESLKKAKQELAFAKDCLKASQEVVEDAQKSYTGAYKAFKEEVVMKDTGWKNVKHIAKKHGVSYITYSKRVASGMEPREAATKPLQERESPYKVVVGGEAIQGNRSEICEQLGLNYFTISSKMSRKKIGFEEAIKQALGG